MSAPRPDLKPERVGEAFAVRDTFTGEARRVALGKLGLSESDLREAAVALGALVASSLTEGDMGPLLRCSRGYVRTQRMLRQQRTSHDAVAPDPILEGAAPVLPAAKPLRPLAKSPDRLPSAEAPQLAVPTYLQADAKRPLEESPRTAAEPLASAAPEPALVEQPPNDGSETAVLAVPSALGAMFAPKSSPLPFSGEADPARVAESVRPLGPDEVEDQSGETAELPVPAELARMFAAAQPFAKKAPPPAAAAPTLGLEQYAAFRAALVVHGQEDAATLVRFGVRDVAQKEALQAEYFRRFTEEPELRERFQVLLEAEIARVRGGGR